MQRLSFREKYEIVKEVKAGDLKESTLNKHRITDGLYKIVYFDTRGPNGRFAPCECENAVRTRGRGRQAEVEGKCCIK